MKALIFVLLSLFSASVFAKDVYVKGYVKKDGTYVAPYVRTEANDTKLDNYSTKGNVNPYTGKKGTVNPYDLPKSNNPYSYED